MGDRRLFPHDAPADDQWSGQYLSALAGQCELSEDELFHAVECSVRPLRNGLWGGFWVGLPVDSDGRTF
jgi:hypothetical protein